MRKKGLCAIFILLIAITTFVLTACDDRTEASKLTVSFETNGGSAVLHIAVEEGSSINLPITIKERYIFVGWYTSGVIDGDALTAPYKPTKDITLYAKWTADNPDIVKHTVSFVSNGGSAVLPIAVEEGSSINLPITIKEHYTFMGWFEREDFSGSPLSSSYIVTKNTTLYVKWQVKKYIVSFDANGGSAVLQITVDGGGSVVLSEPTKDGLIFDGWFENEDLSGNALVSSYVPKRDITLYAKWISEEEKYFEFVPNKEGETTVSYGVKYRALPKNGEINIPAVYKELPVINIVDFGFYGCDATTINIPSSIISIGSGAFRNCMYLRDIIIPENVASIGDMAFHNCDELITVTFADNSKLTTLGDGAFQSCDKLTTVTFGRNSQLQNMKNSTFNNCRSLVEVVLPDSLTSIGNTTFAACASLTSIVIPKNVKSIGTSAFIVCSMLETVTFSEGSTITDIGERAFDRCSGLTNIVIPASVTSIGSYAFSGCSSLTSIVIPTSVTNIGHGAFSNCSNLGSITILGSVTSIGNYTFSGCSRLTDIAIPTSVTSIGNYAFSGCSSLNSVTIEEGVTIIGGSAFGDCSSLTNIIIPASVMNMGTFIFRGCNKLVIYAKIDVQPSGWLSTWNDSNCSVVWDCENNQVDSDGYKIITIDDIRYGIKDNHAKFLGKLNISGDFTVPTSISYNGENYAVTSIGMGAFSGCTNLTSIVIPGGVTSIGYSAFSGCTNLTSIVIPDGVTSIGGSTFSGCSSLGSITIPNSVTSIGSSAFSGCARLTINIKRGASMNNWSGFWNTDNRPIVWIS